MGDHLAHALAYAARGISVFPLLPRSKEPMVKNGFKQAVTDHAQIRRWWSRRDCNIGIATGAPAGFWVLDVDGPEAEAVLAALEAQHGALPATVQQKTGRGRHLCFRWEPDGPEMRNRSKVGGAPIDVRGNGGYIVAPPSVHPGDPKKGVVPGRIYAWDPGRSPDEIAFAAAPGWLVELCKPRDQATPAQASAAAGPRPAADGRASKYGEAVLDSCLRAITTAQKGARDSTLYRFACKAAGLVPTGHLESGYLRQALLHAGGTHVPDAMTQAQLERQVDRAMVWGEGHAWGPDPQRGRVSGVRREQPAGPVQQALARADGLAELAHTVPADRRVAIWLAKYGLSVDGLPGAFERLRLIDGALAMALQRGPADAPDGLAVFRAGGGGACLGWKGLSEQRVAVLSWPEGAQQLLVTTHLLDAWTLGLAAFDSGDPMAVVIAPRLSVFAGAPLGDKWGRVSVTMPAVDPARPAWTWPGMACVYLAVRRDLKGPDLRSRKALGGTQAVQLEGEAAAWFWAGLAQASWSAAGANAVRVMRPPAGRAGFSDSGSR